MPDFFAPRRPVAAHKFTVEAVCRVRWRGNSFDAYDAQARLGIAVAEALGVDVQDRAAVDRLMERVAVEAERAATDDNPAEAFDPEAEGEMWRFHVRLLDEVPEDVLARVKADAAAAVDAARNFTGAHLLDASPS